MPLPNDASKGLVTARDPSTLRQGELSEARACEYHVGSPHLYKQAGRASLNADLGDPVQAICRFQYDIGDSKLIAVAGGAIYESAESTVPTFSVSTVTGLDEDVIPQFSAFNDRWIMCNGVDTNRIREPEGATDVGGTVGNWRPNGMQPPSTKPTYDVVGSSTTAVRPTTSSGDYDDNDRAIDADSTTYAEGGVGDTSTWTFGSNFASSACTLYIDHTASGGTSGGRGPANPKFDVVDSGEEESSTLTVEYTLDISVVSPTWVSVTTTPTFGRVTAAIPITIGTAISGKLAVRGTLGGTGVASHKIYDIRVSGGSTIVVAATNDIYYGFTEVYWDSQGNVTESNLSPITQATAATVNGSYGVVLTLPAKVNTRATKFYIYRSVDEEGGGYPYMYRVGSPASSVTSWTDDFTTLAADIPTDGNLLAFYQVTYPTGETFIYEAHDAPPLSTLAATFQGVVVYVPAASGLGHRLYYSLASTVSIAGIEQVPFFQYLDFQSQRNDLVISIAVTNGGKSLLVFFSNYTMLVNYLPQASDGVFDNRIKEYVSNNRGTSGRLTSCEFTLPAGQTLVASVDALGLWVTNGVNQMDEWSRDLNFITDFTGVDLTQAELVDNTAKRRLELLYTDASGNRAEHHFFYGRLKEDGDGKSAPCITGPTPMGVRCKHYTQIDGSWVGFSGDASATGDVFLEEAQAADDANGYDSNGVVPWSFALVDQYVGGLSKAQIVESVTSRWGLGLNKTMALEVRLTRDSGGHTVTKTKQVVATPGSSSYIHTYGDRARCRYTDLTSTAAPAFVGQEITVRDGGPSRDA